MAFDLTTTLSRPMTRRAATAALAGLFAAGAGVRVAAASGCGDGAVEIDGMCVPAAKDDCRDMGCGEGYRCVDGRCERVSGRKGKKKAKKAPAA